jgi:hypothetical protein
MTDPTDRSIARWLRYRGWKQFGAWWYRPLPGWRGNPAPHQRIYSQRDAYEEERRKAIIR